MGRENITPPELQGIDWRGVGYVFSVVGIILLGAEAKPKPGDPWWYWPTLIGGVVTSITGFGLRYMAHLKQRRELAQTRREAERR